MGFNVDLDLRNRAFKLLYPNGDTSALLSDPVMLIESRLVRVENALADHTDAENAEKQVITSKPRPITSDDIIAADIAERDKTISFIRNHAVNTAKPPAPATPTLIEAVEDLLDIYKKWSADKLQWEMNRANEFMTDISIAVRDGLKPALSSAKAADAKRRRREVAMEEMYNEIWTARGKFFGDDFLVSLKNEDRVRDFIDTIIDTTSKAKATLAEIDAE